MKLNEARIVGYLLNDPVITASGDCGEECATMRVRTVRREANNVNSQVVEDVMVYYDQRPFNEFDVRRDSIMPQIKKLERYDVVLFDGVCRIVTRDKRHICPYCNTINAREMGTFIVMYPLQVIKLDSKKTEAEFDEDAPLRHIVDHYREISNKFILAGTIVSELEMIGKPYKPVCRYKIAVDRSLHMSNEPDVRTDYPWVYSYGENATKDYERLSPSSTVCVKGYYHTREVTPDAECYNCGETYRYRDYVVDFIPYSVEYLDKYKTDADIEREEELKARGIITD